MLVLSLLAGCVSGERRGGPGREAVREVARAGTIDALEEVRASGPMEDSRTFIEDRVESLLEDRGFSPSRVEVGESTEAGYNPPFEFYVRVDSGIPVWVSVEGFRDPLHLLHGVNRTIREAPMENYGREVPLRVYEVLDEGYFFESSDGAPFLDRLEGKIESETYGFETFVRGDPLDRGDVSRIDHYYWRKGIEAEEVAEGLWLDENHARKYGFR